MNLSQIKEQSDERITRKLNLANQEEVNRLDTRTHGSLEVMLYKDEEMIFRQQGERVSWGGHKAKYVAAGYYPSTKRVR